MANQEHLDILKQGVEVWNEWRHKHSDIQPDLSDANFSGVNLIGINLVEAILNKADLSHANLVGANLLGANLSGAFLNAAHLNATHLKGADLRWSHLKEADLRAASLIESNLFEANLFGAILVGANLTGANLSGANLTGANLSEANLSGCRVYAISAWNTQLVKAIQTGLIITPAKESTITVDNLKVAQFIYLLLNNKEIRDVIDTIAKKAVLILGRFTSERKAILDTLRDELRKQNYLPILFDFDKPASRDITETVSTLAHMARFVIADITEPKSIPQELSRIIPFLPSVPIVPLLQASEREYGMYEHFISYPWVLPIYQYRNLDELVHSIEEQIIEPAEEKVRELAIEKAKRLERP